MFKRLLLFLTSFIVSVVASLAATYLVVLRPLRRSWGIEPTETGRPLPGDDLVPDASVVETRGLTIDAPPSAVFPWLRQMGYGRGGWYSYDKMDNKTASADRVMPELQDLAVGDVMPAWPEGGFQIRGMDPDRSLVLYLDSALVTAQPIAATSTAEPSTAGLKVAGGMGSAAMSEFKASWVFVLEPVDDGRRTRVIERMRAWTPERSPLQKLVLPMFDLGVFLMTRKQLLGLQERVERAAESKADLAA